jgi:hypothetical protein
VKTTDKILLYDDYCPLCTWYSGLFVKSGLLKAGNRVAFSKADLSVLTAIDIEKGKDEIPLFDPATQQTLYGIDSLLEILGQRFLFIKKAGNNRPVKWLLQKLYKFVSYNRKVIVARKCGSGTFDCSPVFNVFYRTVFIFAFLIFNTFMLLPLHDHVFSYLSFYHLSSSQLQAGHFALVGTNFFLAAFLKKRTAIEFLGQVTVLSVVNILLLTTVMLLNLILPVSEWIILFFLVSITAFLIKEYWRRMKYAGIAGSYKPIIWVNIVCLTIFLGYVFIKQVI